MTKFEELTKDTETLADFLTLINDNSRCDCCMVVMECDKLQKAGETYRLCERSWDAWLNKEILTTPKSLNKVNFDSIRRSYDLKLSDLIELEEYYHRHGCEEDERRISEEIELVRSFTLDLTVLKSLYEVAPNSPFRKELEDYGKEKD